MNLAFSDLVLIHINCIFVYNSFSGGPAAGPFWCTYYGLMGGLSGTSAIMSIAMIAIERHSCVSRPLDPSSKITGKKAMLRIVAVWSYAAIFSFLPLFGISHYVPEGFLTSCSFDFLSDKFMDKCFIIVFFVAAWCVPMIIVTRCYVGIVLCLHKSQKQFLRHPEDINFENFNIQIRREIRLIRICAVLILIWTVSWTPYAVMALIGVFTDRSWLTPLRSMFPGLLCKLASVCDPFIYGLFNKQFKNELIKKLSCIMVYPLFNRTLAVESQDHVNTEENADSREECETAFVNEDLDRVSRSIGSSSEGPSRVMCVIHSSKSESKVDDSFDIVTVRNASPKSVHVMLNNFKLHDVIKFRRSI
ncbi:opsin, ultraviolet-sensitive [Nephila pilipes]|uniref:Opsin, ultraviolet-sensitive n=1 Tax=Nephila pilipes TaxID=299642 RepID=A0A8X6TFN1_NEPPI|nr:opsin, ultraviolet-sensitive [Nephila pilipes]